jgi:hypothetical protein
LSNNSPYDWIIEIETNQFNFERHK